MVNPESTPNYDYELIEKIKVRAHLIEKIIVRVLNKIRFNYSIKPLLINTFYNLCMCLLMCALLLIHSLLLFI